MIAMEIQDLLIKVGGYPVVNGLTLTVEEEERVGIVDNFHDALSVMNVLCGLTLPDSGEIWIYNMPPRQALQRGLINYIHQLSPTDTLSAPVVITTHTVPPQLYGTNVVVHSLSHIEIFNKLIHNNYKFINLTLERSDILP